MCRKRHVYLYFNEIKWAQRRNQAKTQQNKFKVNLTFQLFVLICEKKNRISTLPTLS